MTDTDVPASPRQRRASPQRRSRPGTTKKKTATPDASAAQAVSVFEGLGRATAPLNVVARVHAYPPRHNAGSEWMLHSMLRALVARGHEVSVWLSRYSPDRAPYQVDGVHVVPYAARQDFGAAAKSADVIIAHHENVPSAGALARGMGRPFVALAHNTAPVVFKNIGRGAVSLAVYNSLHMQAEAEAFFCEYTPALRPEQSIVVRPPVLGDDYRTTPGDHVTLINLNADKGGALFWQVAERLPDLRFLGVKGAYGQQIERRGGLPNVEVVEHMPGERMRDEVYARTRILLVPSASESWGRVAVEAMASGIPVVAAPTTGLAECLGEAGIFAERGDVDAWVEAVQALTDPAQWAAASERSLARAKELDPAADLAEWCTAVEAVTSKG
ncbi:glycosyltransferase family 4 protein [Actinomadura viridis]|uniref:Glycosyltransferase involved in cell wall biosynthesis n=1 Tax=Actinomadura viridis TaxID=58110 RepID=A0A931DKU0_9ACTN|nr:glycosyltransferase family 4 protein [Actinomadura viridis]MBG6089907.1 glycosyltransferase involved in cell wall biosynthesis [Actinomadura viridis]